MVENKGQVVSTPLPHSARENGPPMFAALTSTGNCAFIRKGKPSTISSFQKGQNGQDHTAAMTCNPQQQGRYSQKGWRNAALHECGLGCEIFFYYYF